MATQRAANRRSDILRRGTWGHPTNPRLHFSRTWNLGPWSNEFLRAALQVPTHRLTNLIGLVRTGCFPKEGIAHGNTERSRPPSSYCGPVSTVYRSGNRARGLHVDKLTSHSRRLRVTLSRISSFRAL